MSRKVLYHERCLYTLKLTNKPSWLSVCAESKRCQALGNLSNFDGNEQFSSGIMDPFDSKFRGISSWSYESELNRCILIVFVLTDSSSIFVMIVE